MPPAVSENLLTAALWHQEQNKNNGPVSLVMCQSMLPATVLRPFWPRGVSIWTARSNEIDPVELTGRYHEAYPDCCACASRGVDASVLPKAEPMIGPMRHLFIVLGAAGALALP